MALPEVDNVNYPTPDEIRRQWLADYFYAGKYAGLSFNVAKGSDAYYRAQAVANRLSIPFNNNRLAAQANSPEDATGDDLTELAARHGVPERPAVGASGHSTVTVASGSVTIPSGYKCTSGDGLQYQTTGSDTVSDGETVEIQAVDTGVGTNLAAATILTWDSAALGNLGQTCVVATGGLSDGADADTEEVLRTRLLRRLEFASAGGNPSQVNDWAEAASSAVEVAFTYSGLRGPSTYDVAIVSTDSDRIAASATVSTVAAYILGEMPGANNQIVTTVAAEQVDLIADIELPLPVNAGGAGGGWRDAVPWPSDAETGVNVYAEVTVIALATRQITVNSTNTDPPVAGKRFAVWNPTGGSDSLGAMHEFTIQSVGGVSGAYVITIDASSDSISFITTGMYCSAGAYNVKVYAEELRDALRALGPGEKSSDPDMLPRGRRTPGPDVSYPSEITSVLLSQVSNEYPEILDIEYADVFDTGTGAAGTGLFTARTVPSVPVTTADPPNLLTIGNLAFRRKV